MPNSSKATRHSRTDALVHYLAGNAPLPHAFFSLSNLTEALRDLLDDDDVSKYEIVSRVNCMVRDHHFCSDEVAVVKRALACRATEEPLFFALMRVRQARARRAYPRRRR